jgi:hypothetical protein
MTIASDFTDHAGDGTWIRNFFRTNIVTTTFASDSRNFKGVHAMGAREGYYVGTTNLDYAGQNQAGDPMRIVTVANQPDLDDTFNAYWCPYSSQAARASVLSNAASWMFTAKMDGCTFGVGSPAGDGSRYVAHVNAGGIGNTQMAMLRGLSMFAADDGLASLEPNAYRGIVPGDVKATTFGILVHGNQWRVYSQLYILSPWDHTLTYVDLLRVA